MTNLGLLVAGLREWPLQGPGSGGLAECATKTSRPLRQAGTSHFKMQTRSIYYSKSIATALPLSLRPIPSCWLSATKGSTPQGRSGRSCDETITTLIRRLCDSGSQQVYGEHELALACSYWTAPFLVKLHAFHIRCPLLSTFSTSPQLQYQSNYTPPVAR